MHPPPKLILDLPELRPHAITAALPLKLEGTAPRSTTDKDEAQKGECLRPTKATTFALDRRVATKLDQSRVVRMQCKRGLLQPLAHRVPEQPRVSFMLETDDNVIRVAQNEIKLSIHSPPPLCDKGSSRIPR
ncbi:hypothetical protein D3C72_1862890 [compost metagenome]